ALQTTADIHATPPNARRDRAAQRDENRKPRAVGVQSLLDHVGSPSVRALIADRQPALSLHGHIQESKALDTVGRTPVVNPGSVYFSGTLQGVLLDLRDGDLAGHLFVTG